MGIMELLVLILKIKKYKNEYNRHQIQKWLNMFAVIYRSFIKGKLIILNGAIV